MVYKNNKIINNIKLLNFISQKKFNNIEYMYAYTALIDHIDIFNMFCHQCYNARSVCVIIVINSYIYI